MPKNPIAHLLRVSTGAALVAAALLPAASAQSEASYTLRFGALVVDGTPWDDHLKALKEGVEARTGGAIALRLYEQDIAPSELALVRDCASGGTFNGVAVSNSALATGLDIPLFAMLELPYLFRSDAEVDAVLDGPLFSAANEALTDSDLVLGSWSETGWYSFGTNALPLRSPADLVGKSFRVQESWMEQQTHAALGLRSRTLSPGVVDRFLQTGEIQGFDATPFFTLAAGWASAITHFTLTRHSYQAAEILYSRSFWSTLPPELQSALLGRPAEEAATARGLVREVDLLMQDALRERGIQVVQPDQSTLDAFAAATLPVHAKFLELHPEMRALYDGIQQQLAMMRSVQPDPAPVTPRRSKRFQRLKQNGAHNHHKP